MTTKECVLFELSNNKGNVVSGEYLAEKCNVSRAAIWKAVNSLRNEGVSINGTTNGGYLMDTDNDLISEQTVLSYLEKKHPDMKNVSVECFKEIDSTNSYAKRILTENNDRKKNEFKIIIAESQTAGRGRLGRSFCSPANTGIYLSIIYSPEEGISEPSKITAYSAVAVSRAVKKLYNIETQIKWINDIFYNSKKISGILTEGFTNFESGIIESAVIGIGINIAENPTQFTDDVAKIAGALFPENTNSKAFSRCELASEIAAQVYNVLSENPKSVLDEYRNRSFLIGRNLQVYPVIGNEKASYRAKAIAIDDDFSLMVQLEDGSFKTLGSGEVSLKSDNF